MDGESSSVVGVVGEILSLTSGSGEELAAQVGVSYASLYAWSRGRRRPTVRNACALADVVRQRAKRLSELADVLVGMELGKASDGASVPAPELGALATPPDLPTPSVPPPRPD